MFRNWMWRLLLYHSSHRAAPMSHRQTRSAGAAIRYLVARAYRGNAGFKFTSRRSVFNGDNAMTTCGSQTLSYYGNLAGDGANTYTWARAIT